MNICVVKGHVTRDPELRYLPNGTSVCDLGIAVNRKWVDQNGEKKEEVSFFDCQAWSKTAEIIAQYFTKGKPIIIQGRLKQETWQDKTSGQTRSKVKVVIDRFEFCGDVAGNRAASDAPAREAVAEAPSGAASGVVADEDMPF